MKLWSKKTELFFSKINFYSFLLLVFSMPFDKRIIPPLIVLWVITWILEGNFKSRFKNLTFTKLPFIFIITFYLWHVISLSYSANINEGLFDIEVKFSILLFPLLFTGANSRYKENSIHVLKAYILGNFLCSLICIVSSFYKTYYLKTIIADVTQNEFLYTHLSIFQHPSYFAMQILLSISIICFLFFKDLIQEKIQKFFYLFLFIFLVVFIFLLSSRAGLISLFVVGSTILAFLFLKQKTRLHKIILVVPLLLIVCLTVTNKRFTHFYNNTITHSSQTDNSTNVRLQIWRSALNISQHNLIFGVGAGDIKSELKKEYMISGNEFAEKNNLNVHNQFIETLLGQGLI